MLGFLLASGVSPARATESPPDADPASSEVTWQVRLDGRDLGDLDDRDPLTLGSDEPLVVDVTMNNEGESAALIRSMRLQGRVLGLVFFRYTIRLDIPLEPGQESQRTLEVPLDDLAGQAVGVLPGDLMLLGEEGEVLVEDSLTVEVDGSLWSAYGIFGLAVAGMTLVLLAALLLALWRSTLPNNRWKRATHFAGPGLGLGLTLTFTLSATGNLAPDAGAWLPIVALFGIGAFLLGYFLPLGKRGAASGPLPQQRTEEPASEPTSGRVSSP